MFGATCNAAPVTRSVDVGTAEAVATSAASPVPEHRGPTLCRAPRSGPSVDERRTGQGLEPIGFRRSRALTRPSTATRVFTAPISAFTLDRFSCSRSADLSVHGEPISAPSSSPSCRRRRRRGRRGSLDRGRTPVCFQDGAEPGQRPAEAGARPPALLYQPVLRPRRRRRHGAAARRAHPPLGDPAPCPHDEGAEEGRVQWQIAKTAPRTVPARQVAVLERERPDRARFA